MAYLSHPSSFILHATVPLSGPGHGVFSKTLGVRNFGQIILYKNVGNHLPHAGVAEGGDVFVEESVVDFILA